MWHPSADQREPAGLAGGFMRVHRSGNSRPSRSLTPPRRRVALPTILVALLAGSANQAFGEVLVEGQPEAVHIDARDVPLREVLDALRAKFNFQYRSNDALDTRMTGTFNGPLPRVTARILDGYDFAANIAAQNIDVLILRQHGPNAVPAVTPGVTIAKRSPAPVMTAAQANRYERGLAR
jgi:hypothetical protein